MALATTCPSCKTSFKVIPDQLKLRRGLVRCGMCQHIFSGIEYLRYVSDSRTAKERASRKEVATAEAEASPQTVVDDLNTAFFLPETQFAPPSTVPMPGAIADSTDSSTDSAIDADLSQNDQATNSPISVPQTQLENGLIDDATADEQSDNLQDDTVTDLALADTQIADQDKAERPVSKRRRGRKSRRQKRAAQREIARQSETKPITDPADDKTAVQAIAGAERAAQQQTETAQVADEATSAIGQSESEAGGTEEDLQGIETSLPDAWQNTAVFPRADDQAEQPATRRKKRRNRADTKKTSASLALSEAYAQDHFDPNAADIDEEDAIDFFGRSSKPSFDFDLPPLRVWLSAAALVLLLCLQIAIGSRDSLAARFPATRALLESITAPLGLLVRLPINTEAITIESFDLANSRQKSKDGTHYVLNMLLRNHGEQTLQWPAVELTLTDNTGGIVVRKGLLASDYLNPNKNPVESGIAPASEHAVSLKIHIKGATASGYSAVLFYP